MSEGAQCDTFLLSAIIDCTHHQLNGRTGTSGRVVRKTCTPELLKPRETDKREREGEEGEEEKRETKRSLKAVKGGVEEEKKGRQVDGAERKEESGGIRFWRMEKASSLSPGSV